MNHGEWNPMSHGNPGTSQPMPCFSNYGMMVGSRGGAGPGIGFYKCPKCEKTYERKISLNRHLNLECGKEPHFACPICPHRTKHKHNLIAHINSRHRGKEY